MKNNESIYTKIAKNGKNNIIDVFFEMQDRSRAIVLFGAGFALNSLLHRFEKNNFCNLLVCDNDTNKHNTQFNGKHTVLSLETCINKAPDALYVITSPKYFWEIKKDLEKKVGAENVCPIDFECGHYFSGDEFIEYFTKNTNRFKNIECLLSDELSKKTYQNVLYAHSTGLREDFEKACCANDDWYLFKSLLKPTEKTTYVDCGTFDGDTVLLYHDRAGGKHGAIYAFEPDSMIIDSLIATISENGIENVTIIPKGVYSYSGKMRFTHGGVYSAVSHSNMSVKDNLIYSDIEVVKMDDELNGIPVSMIKMDLEGAELQALKGAENLIKTNKPRLAICLYHNASDLLEIPEYIHSIVPEYKLYVRHHSKSCTDTILYAIA